MHTVTRKWLAENGTKGIAWNREQLKVLGLNYPPPKGWKDAICGTAITDEQRVAFQQLKGRSVQALEDERKAPSRKVLAGEVYYTCPDGKGSWQGRWLEPHEIGTFPGPK